MAKNFPFSSGFLETERERENSPLEREKGEIRENGVYARLMAIVWRKSCGTSFFHDPLPHVS